jgi:NAD(P)-dependent dehydrogenase (short-subunit alcohol dehydrogenase family)
MAASPLSTSTTIILITGANQGIGLAIARTLSNPSSYPNHHIIIGSRLSVNGSSAISSLLAESLNSSVPTTTIDLTYDASIAAVAATVSET